MLILKALSGTSFQTALFAALLFIPAGTWAWPRAFQFLIAYWFATSAASIFLALYSPESLVARLEAPVSERQSAGDRTATALLTVMMLGWIVFIPIDVFHLQLVAPPTSGVAAAGAALGGLGLLIIIVTLYQNEFAVPVVRDQSERHQVVVDTGLYSIIRHPMYVGFLTLFAGMGLWLESYASVMALVLVAASFVPRIKVEEKTLKASLEGYTAYADKVRYRLIPCIW